MPSEIVLRMNSSEFEYDIRGLLGAFYPGIPVKKNPEEIPAPLAALVTLNRQETGWEFCVQGEDESVSVDIPFPEEEKERKNTLKRAVYRALETFSGKSLPWGVLTGIRPAKLATERLAAGLGTGETARALREEYLVSTEKAALCTQTAKVEQMMLDGKDYGSGFSVYAGIPFCPTRCLYCSFASNPISVWEGRTDLYLDALIHEIRKTASMMRGKLRSLYIGGGTPTSLRPEQLDRLIRAFEETYDLSAMDEFTVEAGRPDSITREKLQVLKDHGVSRISINPQTMNQKTLDLIGRKHTPEDIREAFELARSMGFDNINMDIIIGLPEEEAKDVCRTLEEIRKMAPDSLTVHSMALKRASRLKDDRELFPGVLSRNIGEALAIAEEGARAMGMYPYYLYRQKNMVGNHENVGWCAPGKEGIYNVLMMEEIHTVLALGAGSVTKAVWPDGRIERADNIKNVEQYISRIDEMIERKRVLFKSDEY